MPAYCRQAAGSKISLHLQSDFQFMSLITRAGGKKSSPLKGQSDRFFSYTAYRNFGQPGEKPFMVLTQRLGW